jgi:hypothetical protein
LEARTVILGVALVFIALFAGLTITGIVRGGGGVIAPGLLSLLVLALLGFGIVGALRHPPDE